MTYPDNKTILTVPRTKDFEFSTTKKGNYLWKIEDTLEINFQNIFEKTESLYIADGHHRTEALKIM
jgi:uncharacterized protein (DUF1015 family)